MNKKYLLLGMLLAGGNGGGGGGGGDDGGDKPFDELTWDQVIASTKTGKYKTFTVGAMKELDLGSEGIVHMQIVGIDADDLADGSGKAPLTFISKELLKTSHRMNPYLSGTTEGTGAIGGWDKSEMRTYLNDTIKPLIPQTVRDGIKQVAKTSVIITTSLVQNHHSITNDYVWIPSAREIYGDTTYEKSGAMYTDLFNDNPSRIKLNMSGNARNWWLRSAYNKENFARVSLTTGGLSNYQAGGTDFITLGFCL